MKDLYDPEKRPHGKGWFWSKRLLKWRRHPMREFSLDRQGIHLIGGGLTAAGMWLFDGLELVGFWGIVTWLFLRYEETEEQVIGDDAYVDIGGWFIGFAVAAAGFAAAMRWL